MTGTASAAFFCSSSAARCASRSLAFFSSRPAPLLSLALARASSFARFLAFASASSSAAFVLANSLSASLAAARTASFARSSSDRWACAA